MFLNEDASQVLRTLVLNPENPMGGSKVWPDIYSIPSASNTAHDRRPEKRTVRHTELNDPELTSTRVELVPETTPKPYNGMMGQPETSKPETKIGGEELVLESRNVGTRPKLKSEKKNNEKIRLSNLLQLDKRHFWHNKPVPAKSDSSFGISPPESVGINATLDILDYGPRLNLRNTTIENNSIIERNPTVIESNRLVNLPIETGIEISTVDQTVSPNNSNLLDAQRHLQGSFVNLHGEADQSDQLSTENLSVTETRLKAPVDIMSQPDHTVNNSVNNGKDELFDNCLYKRMKERNVQKENVKENIENKNITIEAGRIKSMCKMFEIVDKPMARGLKRLGVTPKKINENKTEKRTPVSRKKLKTRKKDLIPYKQQSLMDLWSSKKKDL